MMGERSIVVWDPNGVNPYGQEVARLLSKEFSVETWLAHDADPAFGPRSKPLLGTGMGSDRSVLNLLRRFWLPLWFVMRSCARRDLIVIPWVRGTYESLLFGLAARFTLVVVVNHNPVKSREMNHRRQSRFDALCRRAATVLIHSNRFLQDLAPDIQSKTRVVVHPPYVGWADYYRAHINTNIEGSAAFNRKIRVLFLGALRADKGVEFFPQIVEGLDPTAYSFEVCGTGELPDELIEAARSRGLDLVVNVSRSWQPSSQIASSLNAADVLICPYRDATVSGTVALAASLGLSVLAFQSGGLQEYLSRECLVPVGDVDAMLTALAEWRSGERQLNARSLDTWKAEAVLTWQAAIEELVS
jgi:glycosyltransferase involved in cell wall biosynthesis